MDPLIIMTGTTGGSAHTKLANKFGLNAAGVEKGIEHIVPTSRRGLPKDTARRNAGKQLPAELDESKHGLLNSLLGWADKGRTQDRELNIP